MQWDKVIVMMEYIDDVLEDIDMYFDSYTDEELSEMFKEADRMVSEEISCLTSAFSDLSYEDEYFVDDSYYSILDHYNYDKEF